MEAYTEVLFMTRAFLASHNNFIFTCVCENKWLRREKLHQLAAVAFFKVTSYM